MTIPAESFGDPLGRSEIIIINLLMKRVVLREIGGLSPITQRVAAKPRHVPYARWQLQKSLVSHT